MSSRERGPGRRRRTLPLLAAAAVLTGAPVLAGSPAGAVTVEGAATAPPVLDHRPVGAAALDAGPPDSSGGAGVDAGPPASPGAGSGAATEPGGAPGTGPPGPGGELSSGSGLATDPVDSGSGPADPPNVDRPAGGGEGAAREQPAPDDGPVGLLSLIAAIGLLGASAGTIRVAAGQRTARTVIG